jgi:hypothetical protein
MEGEIMTRPKLSKRTFQEWEAVINSVPVEVKSKVIAVIWWNYCEYMTEADKELWRWYRDQNPCDPELLFDERKLEAALLSVGCPDYFAAKWSKHPKNPYTPRTSDQHNRSRREHWRNAVELRRSQWGLTEAGRLGNMALV